MKLLPNAKEIGECTARCLTTSNPHGCVGAATKAECECTHKCAEAIPAALKDKGKAYEQCYSRAIAAVCY